LRCRLRPRPARVCRDLVEEEKSNVPRVGREGGVLTRKGNGMRLVS